MAKMIRLITIRVGIAKSVRRMMYWPMANPDLDRQQESLPMNLERLS
jgi:hypothetical protein